MPKTRDEGADKARHPVRPDSSDSEDLVKHMKVRGNFGCTDCDSRVQGEGSRVERITALDSGEQTPMSAGLCLEESLEILCWREDRTRRSGSLLGTTSSQG